MDWRVRCPGCQGELRLTEQHQGKSIACPRCKTTFSAPAPPQAPLVAPVVAPPLASPVAAGVSRVPPQTAAPPVGTPVNKSRLIVIGVALAGGGVAVLLLVAVTAGLAFWLGRSGRVEPIAKKKETPVAAKPVEKAIDPGATIDTASVQKVKKATVYLRVNLASKAVAEGTGFFGVEPGIVLTNAHVVGMRERDSQPPRSIEVVLHSGEPNEQSFAGKLVAVDRHSDLAVIAVDLPANERPSPLTISPSRNVAELQKVYIFGFPFGQKLGRNITISESSISSIRKDESGVITNIQVNGGMHPGNSGGPVVNALGQVVGVSVAVIRGTQINFAVPGDRVHQLLDGRLIERSVGEPYRENTQVKVPIALNCFDPLERIRDVKLVVWTGEIGAPKAESTQAPPPRKGDSARSEFRVAYRGGKGTAVVALPSLPKNHCYWIQPVVVNGANEPRWMAVEPYEMLSPPLERQPAMLRFQPVGPCKTSLVSTSTLYLVNDPDPLKLRSDAELSESWEPSAAGGRLRLTVGKMDMTRDGLPPPPSVRNAVSLVTRLRSNWAVDAQGTPTLTDVQSDEVPDASKKQATKFHESLTRLYRIAAVPLPNRDVKPLESWSYAIPLRTASLDITCTYQGKRRHQGRDEAVVLLDGMMKGTKDAAVHGRIDGRAVIALATGSVIELDLRASMAGSSLSATEQDSESVEIRLTRQPSPK